MKNLLVDGAQIFKSTDAFERGHFVCHGSWSDNALMVSEMSVTTNAFPQLKGFIGYRDVEEFGRMISKYTDVLIITSPIDNCKSVVKVFLWEKKNSIGILGFCLPNTEHAYKNLSADDKRYGGGFITDRTVLWKLPFGMDNAKDAIFVQEIPVPGRMWKKQIIKSIRGMFN